MSPKLPRSSSKLAILACATVAVAAAFAAPAQATLLVRSDADGLTVQDKNNLGDRVIITSETLGGAPVYLIVSGNPLDIVKFDRRAGCSAGATADKVVCQKVTSKLNLAMAGGDDHISASQSGAVTASVNLGSGNDRYGGINGKDTVEAGSGNDDVTTNSGDDDISTGSDGLGSDSVSAGPGKDRIREGNIAGGTADVDGGSGNDTIEFLAGDKDVRAIGGDGDDIISLAQGDDNVLGGNGADTVSTGFGDDIIEVKENFGPASADRVTCGFGQDGVFADLKDTVDLITNPGGGTCEEVDRSPVGETPHVKIRGGALRVSAAGRVRVRLACPRGVKKLGCKGALALRLAGRAKASRARPVRYRIAAGRRKAVTLTLSRGDVRAIRRRGGRRGVLVSTERGRIGAKTTVRNPRLRLR